VATALMILHHNTEVNHWKSI